MPPQRMTGANIPTRTTSETCENKTLVQPVKATESARVTEYKHQLKWTFRCSVRAFQLLLINKPILIPGCFAAHAAILLCSNKIWNSKVVEDFSTSPSIRYL